MNVYKIFPLLAFISLIVVANSCKVTYPNEKLIIGKWKPVKVEKSFDTSYLKAQGTQLPKSAVAMDTASQKKGKKSSSQAPAVNKDNQLIRLAQSEERSSFEMISENKQVLKHYPGKTISGTWKMKKKGTRIVVKGKENGKKFTIDILDINDSTLVAKEQFPFGLLKVTYHKEK